VIVIWRSWSLDVAKICERYWTTYRFWNSHRISMKVLRPHLCLIQWESHQIFWIRLLLT